MLFDTTILIDACIIKKAALKKIAELEETEEMICTTQINVLELYKRSISATKSDANIQRVEKLLDVFVVLHIDDDAELNLMEI